MDGKHGVGRPAEILDVYQEMGCDIIGLQETWRSGQSALLQTGYVVYCSGEPGGDGEGKKGQGGVGLAVRKSVSRAEAPTPEIISDRLLKVTLEMCGRARAVTFVVGYGKKRTDYTLTRQRDRKLVRGVTVHPHRHSYYLGSQHRPIKYETAWSLRSEPTGEGGKVTAAYRPATTDD